MSSSFFSSSGTYFFCFRSFRELGDDFFSRLELERRVGKAADRRRARRSSSSSRRLLPPSNRSRSSSPIWSSERSPIGRGSRTSEATRSGSGSSRRSGGGSRRPGTVSGLVAVGSEEPPEAGLAYWWFPCVSRSQYRSHFNARRTREAHGRKGRRFFDRSPRARDRARRSITNRGAEPPLYLQTALRSLALGRTVARSPPSSDFKRRTPTLGTTPTLGKRLLRPTTMTRTGKSP